ncbi:DUF4296 domain-containing protein [Salinimicrobium soli]|uniref:DUF4296 domain-containing protein n=1 Tax=Salinimicrobium soli TaxID=1254399 RepID=UPI003AAE1012
MKRLTSVLLLLVLLISCQDIKKSPKPENLISEDKMVEILTDLALLHGARSYNKNLLQEKGIIPSEYIREKYNIDSTRFRISNNYYTENYKQYQKMYSQVKENLEQLRVKYDSIREQEEEKQDSIRRIIRRDTMSPELKRKKDSLVKSISKLELIPEPLKNPDSLDQ